MKTRTIALSIFLAIAAPLTTLLLLNGCAAERSAALEPACVQQTPAQDAAPVKTKRTLPLYYLHWNAPDTWCNMAFRHAACPPYPRVHHRTLELSQEEMENLLRASNIVIPEEAEDRAFPTDSDSSDGDCRLSSNGFGDGFEDSIADYDFDDVIMSAPDRTTYHLHVTPSNAATTGDSGRSWGAWFGVDGGDDGDVAMVDVLMTLTDMPPVELAERSYSYTFTCTDTSAQTHIAGDESVHYLILNPSMTPPASSWREYNSRNHLGEGQQAFYADGHTLFYDHSRTLDSTVRTLILEGDEIEQRCRARVAQIEPDLRRVSSYYAPDADRIAQLEEELSRIDPDGVFRAELAADDLFARVQPGEEVWIIERPSAQDAYDDDTPGGGALRALLPKATEWVPVPLEHTDVQADVAGYIASVDVTQQYYNPFDVKIEAEYVFPLPTNAAVNEFVMTVGERRIRGVIREREQAEQIYAAAREQGHVASLLTQERANVFTQRVANIEPGCDIDISITYYHTLDYVDGWYEFVFPMVVAPRSNPPHVADGVGAVAYGAAGRSGQATEVQYLRPNQRSGHDIGVRVQINAGVAIEDIFSANHDVIVEDREPGTAVVTLDENDTIPNKDFVLRFKVAGEQVKSAFVTHRDEHGGFFTLMVYPPAELQYVPRGPLEMIFVLDCSGSMSGAPLAQAKAAIEHALLCMQPTDSFQVIRFSENATQLGDTPLIATDDNIARALEYVRGLDSGGGTMMIEGIRAALDFPHDPLRMRHVVFLTDGEIGNESEIVAAVREKLGAARIFSFGVGSAPNRSLLDDMARVGQGVAAYLSLYEDATEVMDLYVQRVSHAALHDVAIDWGGLDVEDVYPERIPDLFVGRPIILTGRFHNDAPATVRLTGLVGGEPVAIEVPTDVSVDQQHPALAAIWARMKIKDLATDVATLGDANGELAGLIRTTALDYCLMSAYTAFVAVDSMSRTGDEPPATVAIPVSTPVGMSYEETVTP